MPALSKRTTIYLDPRVHKALRLKAINNSRSVSEMINELISESLLEDAEDLKAIEERENEPDMSYEEMIKRLKTDGLI